MIYLTFDELNVGDTFGRESFPYQFATVIEKKSREVVFESNGDRTKFILDKAIFDRSLFVRHIIPDGEVVQKQFTPTPPTPTKPE